MNATSLEKQKKGNLYVYKFATGNRTPEYQTPATSVTKRIISSSVWGGLIKSKPKPKPKPTPEKEKEGEGKERKSVSSVEGILMSLVKSSEKNKVNNNNIEGRKSVSNSEEIEGKGNGKGKGKEFLNPIKQELLGKGKGKGEEGRKSVSHVENNVAYVGRFVEEKGRKSTGAKLENDMVSAIALLQVKVLVTDMPAFMQIQAFQCARNTFDSLEKFSAKHIAFNLKKEFDKVYGPAWHCIVGSSFGSFVTHATGCFLYFSMENLCILLFRTKVQRALK